MKTKAKRKRHSAAFKATVAMEAMLGVKTVAQIAREHSVHPVQVSQWKTVLRERVPELFESGSKPGEDSERLVADPHRKIGELTVDLDYLKKISATGSVSQLRDRVEEDGTVSVREQCGLLGIARSGLYHRCQPETPENLRLMRRLDELHLLHPVYGSRRLTCLLEREGMTIHRKRVMRLREVMGIEAIDPMARTSLPGAGHRVFPYLLKSLEINGPDQGPNPRVSSFSVHGSGLGRGWSGKQMDLTTPIRSPSPKKPGIPMQRKDAMAPRRTDRMGSLD